MSGQEVAPPDTYSDPGVEALLSAAREARFQAVEGLESYEGKIRQRVYIGVTAFQFRRERGLLEHERVARIRWNADGTRVIQWTGVRTAIPVAGIDTGDRDTPPTRATVTTTDSTGSVTVGGGLEQNLAEEMLDETDVPAFGFDPREDRLHFGSEDEWALHPLADSAVHHYRYASGDTLRIDLPMNQRDIVLYEVLVEPRRADFELIAGSLWFDAESSSLVRATFKPARPFVLALDDPGEEQEIPGFLQPVEAEIDYITIEYSLQELRYWLPRRFAFSGEARLGGLFQIPATVEWSVGEYVVNETQSDLFIEGELPEGWRRQEGVERDEDGTEHPVTVIVPTSEELRSSPDITESFGERSPLSFSDDEITALEGELEGLLPTFQRFRPRFSWGFERGMLRYNRVEGLSAGVLASFPLDPVSRFELSARMGFADVEPNLRASLVRGSDTEPWTLAAYHELRSMPDDQNPFGLTSSLGNLLFGNDRGEYYRATGASLGVRRTGERIRFDVGGFYERQRAIEFGTDFFLLNPLSDRVVLPVLEAEDLDLTGVRGTLSWFTGINPNGLIVTGRLKGEAAVGDARYQRVSSVLSLSHPLPLGLAGAVEVGAGTSFGSLPVQGEFFLGGSETVRGFNSNEFHGNSYWRGRAELATGFAAARIGLFTDWGWAGARTDFGFEDPFGSVGIGGSLLDGLVRVDLARAIRRGDRWKLHLYLDGLF